MGCRENLRLHRKNSLHDYFSPDNDLRITTTLRLIRNSRLNNDECVKVKSNDQEYSHFNYKYPHYLVIVILVLIIVIITGEGE